MATQTKVYYPTRDGKPIGETTTHRNLLWELIYGLKQWYAADPMTYVSGNMMMYYVEGNKHKHLAPDVFVTRGIPDDGPRRGRRARDAYFTWEEGKGPDFVIELTSKSTRRVDETSKLALYRDVLKVAEYFLFDPLGDYLKPRLKGYRLVEGRYDPIEPVDGRLPSLVTGLHLEADGNDLRLFDPATGRWIQTVAEIEEQLVQVAEALRITKAEVAEALRITKAEAAEALRLSQAETDRLRREIEELRRSAGGSG